MPTALPVVRGSSPALYPFLMIVNFDTIISVFQNGSEQRSVRRFGLASFELPYSRLTQSQKNVVRAAVTSAKGAFDTTLTLTLGSTTYTNLSLDSDNWTATEAANTQYTGPLKLSQTLTQDLSPGTSGQPFPTLGNGTISQIPYAQTKRFQTLVSRLPSGTKKTYAEFAGGLANYPSDGLMAWTVGGNSLLDTDRDAIIAHFIANFGRAVSFNFVDEDSVTYTKVRYSSDSLVVRFNGIDDCAISVALEQTF